MKKTFTIFYSWQSDVKENKNLISTSLKEATKSIEKEFDITIKIDSGIENKTGSPIIVQTIFDKIDICDIFIADVTIINDISYIGKKAPNPNVLIELGYAIKAIGTDRIISLLNKKNGNIEDLPFDIRGNRISPFNTLEEKCKDKLVNLLIIAIKSIINEYDNLIKKHLNKDYRKYDLNLFEDINHVCNEELLNESLSIATDSLFSNKDYYQIWDKLSDFDKLAKNNFIDENLKQKYSLFIDELNRFDSICRRNFHLKEDSHFLELLSKKNSGEKLSDDEEFDFLQSKIFQARKEPFDTETWEDSDRRIGDLQEKLYLQGEKVKKTYKEFVKEAKKKLHI